MDNNEPRRLSQADIDQLMKVLGQAGFVTVGVPNVPNAVRVKVAPSQRPRVAAEQRHKCLGCGWPGTPRSAQYCDPCDTMLGAVGTRMWFVDAQAEMRALQEMRKRGRL